MTSINLTGKFSKASTSSLYSLTLAGSLKRKKTSKYKIQKFLNKALNEDI